MIERQVRSGRLPERYWSPEIAHHTCRISQGLIPRMLAPFLAKRTQYKQQLKMASAEAMRQSIASAPNGAEVAIGRIVRLSRLQECAR
ncbi:hypothetical protein NITLEN_100047 [Nitrospira lenta]|uniref:Uncharacterized protein n=1 Tax=Nitrospira lenta TaxID=1436998 RepID=A0A330L4P6_9BACT|nr:hypothetical protein NITLEN_100047 [Nitrospira lenta]